MRPLPLRRRPPKTRKQHPKRSPPPRHLILIGITRRRMPNPALIPGHRETAAAGVMAAAAIATAAATTKQPKRSPTFYPKFRADPTNRVTPSRPWTSMVIRTRCVQSRHDGQLHAEVKCPLVLIRVNDKSDSNAISWSHSECEKSLHPRISTHLGIRIDWTEEKEKRIRFDSRQWMIAFKCDFRKQLTMRETFRSENFNMFRNTNRGTRWKRKHFAFNSRQWIGAFKCVWAVPMTSLATSVLNISKWLISSHISQHKSFTCWDRPVTARTFCILNDYSPLP